MSSFQTSPGSAYSILTVVCVSVVLEEIARRLLPIRYPHRYLAPSGMARAAIGFTKIPSLVLIDGNLNADWYISHILLILVLPYLRDLQNAVFRQNSTQQLSFN